MTTIVTRFPALAIGIVIGLIMGGADLAGGAPVWKAVLTFAIVVAYAAGVTLLGRRSETMSALAGHPVDERWEHIGLEASAWALGLSGAIVLLAFVVEDASGGDWLPYAFMAAVLAVSYFGSMLVLRTRR